MKNFTSCICILGLSGTAFGNVLMDQIGLDDGSSIDTSNATASQNFESAYDGYDIATLDNFTGAGESVVSVEAVITGWNGYGSLGGITGYTVNLHSSTGAAAADLTGDIDSQWIDPADAVVSATWGGVGGDLVLFNVAMTAAVGDNYVSVVPDNEFGTNGQTAIAMSTLGDGEYYQANPGGGFGMPGNEQAGAGNSAYRVVAGFTDPCDAPLEPCATDIDGDGVNDVDDLLVLIGEFGTCGDGTFRPAGDLDGDCCVTVDDVLVMIGVFGQDCVIAGGCCLGDGTCSVETAADCAAAGGDYFGDDSTCADGSCVAAACCIDMNTCADLTEDACNAMGGTYKGDGTSCAGTDCAAVEAGDECTVAIEVFDGANAFDTTNMTAGGDMPDDLMCEGTFLDWGESQDGWYMYVATGGMTHFTTCDAASYDTSMVLYEGS
ncbi:MAG: hypothetical protein QGI78_01960, partial [Phycisphaerales bacterium]|nr:hypothetical protein [Phycisphaerales bacterium]